MNIRQFKEAILKLIDKLGNFFSKIYNDKIKSFKDITQLDNTKNIPTCNKIYIIICILIIYISSLSLLIISIIYTVQFIIKIVKNGFTNNLDFTKELQFIKVDNILTIGGYSFDIYIFISFIICLLYFMAYLFIKINSPSHDIFTEWYYINIFILLSSIIILIYFILFYSIFIEIMKSSAKLTNTIYSFINIDLLKTYLCNYTDPPIGETKFVEGKCNKKFSNESYIVTHVNTYCDNKIIKMQERIINIDSYKKKKDIINIKDDNNISYYDNILSANITGALFTWYYKNFITPDKDTYNFFSLENLLNTNNYLSTYFTNKTNPFLNINNDELKDYNTLFIWTETTGTQEIADSKLSNIKNRIKNYLSMDYEKKRDLIIDLIKNYKKLCDNIVPPYYIFIAIAVIAIILFIIKFSYFISSTRFNS